MRILADENVEGEVVAALRQAGHTVFYIKEISPGVEDTEVLDVTTELSSILLTNDKDFGELIYRDRLISNGVILLRFGKIEIAERIELLLRVIYEHDGAMDRSFTVITATGVRIRQ